MNKISDREDLEYFEKIKRKKEKIEK